MPMQGPMIPPPTAVLAAAAANHTKESLEIDSGRDDDGDVKVKISPAEKRKQTAVQIVLAAGTAVSIVAVAWSPVAAVVIMMAIFVTNAPYSAYKEYQLARLPSLRKLNNVMREDANKLVSAVDVLSHEVDELGPEAERAADVEGELKKMAAEQGRNTDTLVELVKENGRIVREMQDNLRQGIVQDMLKIVMSCDRNSDGTFSENETAMLALKIGMQLEEQDVEFDQEKFKKVMKKAPTISQTIKIVKRLVPALPEEEKGGDSDDEDDFDMFHTKGGDKADGKGAPRGLSLGLAKQPATRKTSRHEKIKRMGPSAATAARSYEIV